LTLLDFSSIFHLKNGVFNNGGLVNISKQDLAEFTAMSKESAISVLKVFQEEGFIEMNGKDIKVLSESSLQKIAAHG
jgi:CRP/FNR family transcriptional regulator